jgi:hypothetical protein
LLKKTIKKIAAIAIILLVLFSPLLLFFDFQRFTPFVLTVWLLSAVYFVFVKDRL